MGAFAGDAMGCPGTKAELSRKSSRSGPDSGTKTEVSHGNSPESGRQRRLRDQLSKKTPGHGIPCFEGLRPFPLLPWDTSVFVPEFPSPAVLRGAAQALRPPRCYRTNRCVRIKETCMRQIIRSLSHHLTRASACSTIHSRGRSKSQTTCFAITLREATQGETPRELSTQCAKRDS